MSDSRDSPGERAGWLRRLAWLPLIATATLWGINLIAIPVPEDMPATEWLAAFAAISAVLGFGVVGAYLSYRLPRNAVGWVLSGFGFWFTFGIVADDAVTLGTVSETTREWLAWSGSWAWAISGSLIAIYLPLLFPDGRLPGHRWRLLLRLSAGATAALVLVNALSVEATAPIRNPMGIAGLTEILDSVGLFAFVLYAVCVLAAAISVIGRFRRSRGLARRQMLLFVASAALVTIGLGSSYALYEMDRPDAANLVVGIVSLTVPASVGMAVLRYRLYDLGRLFKRTATYTALAALLLGVYWAGILAFQSVIGADDSLSVAASTLVAAALFNPARARIQAFINRRFDRAGYDAGMVVDQFSSRLRNEVNLDDLNLDLVKVVGSTLRPAAVSIWVRPS